MCRKSRASHNAPRRSAAAGERPFLLDSGQTAHERQYGMRRDQELVSLFLQAHNTELGSTYVVTSWPDQEDSTRQAVEAVAEDLNGSTIALEHTLLQPFVDERQDSTRFLRVIAPLENDRTLRVPGFDTTLSIDVAAVPKGVNWDEARVLLQHWLRKNVPDLPEESSVHLVPGLPFELRVTVSKVRDETLGARGTFFVMRHVPPDSLEDVVRTAFNRKLPKLAATTAVKRLLLLEKADVLHGYARISEAIETVGREFPDFLRIDEIWLAVTFAWERESALWFYELRPAFRNRRLTVTAKLAG
jgi:hypothetical protein